MIDIALQQLITDSLPKVNKTITSGLATEQLSSVEDEINRVFICASESFPPGLKYICIKRCTPLEQYLEITRPLQPSKTFDLAKSNVFMIKLYLSFKGVELRPFYMFLPFAEPGNLTFIKGTQYMIMPVLGGKIFNVETSSIYMPIPRTRLGFLQFAYSCMKNNNMIHNSVIYSYLHYGLTKNERSNLKPTLMHYILANYGLTDTFKLLFGLDIKVGNEELFNLNPEQWIIYSSSKSITGNDKLLTNVPSIKIAIPTKQKFKLLDSVMCSLFYILDNSSYDYRTYSELDNPKLWLFLLSRFIFKDATHEKKQFDKMNEHLISVTKFMDPITKKVLSLDNIFCNTIFDLFKYIIIHFQDILIHNDPGSMYNKQLATTKYILYPVIYNIFTVMYGLQSLPENLLTHEKITSMILKLLSKNIITKTDGHGELVPFTPASDCMLYATTLTCIPYSDAVNTGDGRKKKTLNISANLLHPSQAEGGCIRWITKSGPTGRNKINPFLNISREGIIIPNDKLKKSLNEVQLLLANKKLKTL